MNELCNPNLNILKKYLSRPGMANHLLVAHANWYVINTHSGVLRKSLRACLSWQQREMWSVSSISQKYEWWSSTICAYTYSFGFKLTRQAATARCRGRGLHKLGGKARETPSSIFFQPLSQNKHFCSPPVRRGTNRNPEAMLRDSTGWESSVRLSDQIPFNSLLATSFPFRPLNSSSTSSCFTFGKWPPLPHPHPPGFLSCNSH